MRRVREKLTQVAPDHPADHVVDAEAGGLTHGLADLVALAEARQRTHAHALVTRVADGDLRIEEKRVGHLFDELDFHLDRIAGSDWGAEVPVYVEKYRAGPGKFLGYDGV